MSAPKRVQMTRNKPWRAEHPDAVIVDRRTKWGNPFKVGDRITPSHPHWPVVAPSHAPWGVVRPRGWQDFDVVDAEHAVALFRTYLDRTVVGGYTMTTHVQAELHRKDLACWCKPGDPCHADVLLELANQETA